MGLLVVSSLTLTASAFAAGPSVIVIVNVSSRALRGRRPVVHGLDGDGRGPGRGAGGERQLPGTVDRGLRGEQRGIERLDGERDRVRLAGAGGDGRRPRRVVRRVADIDLDVAALGERRRVVDGVDRDVEGLRAGRTAGAIVQRDRHRRGAELVGGWPRCRRPVARHAVRCPDARRRCRTARRPNSRSSAAQGGTAADTRAARRADGLGALVNSSRGATFPERWSGDPKGDIARLVDASIAQLRDAWSSSSSPAARPRRWPARPSTVAPAAPLADFGLTPSPAPAAPPSRCAPTRGHRPPGSLSAWTARARPDPEQAGPSRRTGASGPRPRPTASTSMVAMPDALVTNTAP